MKRGERKPAPVLVLPPQYLKFSRRKTEECKPLVAVRPAFGWRTYFIQGSSTRLIKIGRTSQHPEHRLRYLQTASPDVLTLLAVSNHDIEAECHQKFSALRKHGEWFEPSPELLLYIQQLSDTK